MSTDETGTCDECGHAIDDNPDKTVGERKRSIYREDLCTPCGIEAFAEAEFSISEREPEGRAVLESDGPDNCDECGKTLTEDPDCLEEEMDPFSWDEDYCLICGLRGFFDGRYADEDPMGKYEGMMEGGKRDTCKECGRGIGRYEEWRESDRFPGHCVRCEFKKLHPDMNN